MSTFEIEQQLLEHFYVIRQKMDAAHKQEFLQAVDAKVSELEELLPLLMKDRSLAKGSPTCFPPSLPAFCVPMPQ